MINVLFLLLCDRYHQVHGYRSHKTCIVTPCVLPEKSIAWTIFMERDSERPQLNLCIYCPKSDEFSIKKAAWLTLEVSNQLPQEFDFYRASR